MLFSGMNDSLEMEITRIINADFVVGRALATLAARLWKAGRKTIALQTHVLTANMGFKRLDYEYCQWHAGFLRCPRSR